MNLAGYHGQYLHVDLSSNRHRWVPLPEAVLRRFLGGTGLGVYLLLRTGQAGLEPFSPEAGLAFVFSPLVGSPITTSAKFAVVGKSPLTDRYNDSLASSAFALAGKSIGADAILITGQAAVPSLLLIDGPRIELQPAASLWGLGVSEAEQRLRQKLGSSFRAAVIGPAGENRVRFATISHDGRHAGRGGLGAVLGAKNIKAVAIRGCYRCRWADPPALSAYAKSLSARSFGPATAKYRELGTAANLLAFNRLKTLPTRNFQRASFARAEKIAAETLAQSRNRTRRSCTTCTVGCEHVYELTGHPDGVRLEYESLFALGSLCDIDDADAVLSAVRMCDDLGLDTISAGGTIAFAMECVEQGWLAAPWLQFGSGKALQRALRMIALRQDLGTELAEGSRRLAKRLGPAAMARAPQVKGLEMPGYEPRSLQTLALGLAVAARGADHNRSGAYQADFSDRVDRRHADARSVPLAIETEDHAALLDSLILCKFLRGAVGDLFAESAKILTMITGWPVTPDELRATAQRIVAARKLFNMQAGWTPDEDSLPDRFLTSSPADDPTACLTRETLEELVRQYNQQRRWTPEGWIPPSELRRLQLSALVGEETGHPVAAVRPT